MDPARRVTHYTEDEYLTREQASDVKHEYVNGEIFARSGARLRHNTIAANTIGALGNLVRGRPCRTFTSDQRIHIAATGTYTYPDAGVVCGKAEVHGKDGMSLLNPLVLVEVLSPSTASYDRGEKLLDYRRIASLEDVLFVWSTEAHVEHHHRAGDGEWRIREQREGAIELSSLGGALAIADLYAHIDWSAPTDE